MILRSEKLQVGSLPCTVCLKKKKKNLLWPAARNKENPHCLSSDRVLQIVSKTKIRSQLDFPVESIFCI